MSEFDGLLSMIPIGEIADKLGVDETVARQVVDQAVPVLVSGLAANAQDPAGARSLESALGKHSGAAPTPATVDVAEGSKILRHVFGANQDSVVSAVADGAPESVTSTLVKQVLPILAPIVMAWVASQFLSPKKNAPAGGTATANASPTGGIGDMLGGFLGSAQGQQIITGVLGGLLGGGRK